MSEKRAITINEGLEWKKTLAQRHAELVNLRDQNSALHTRRYGMGGDKSDKIEPVYDVKVLDKMVTRVAREMRLLDQQIKATNAVATIVGYVMDEDVLGELA